MKDCIFCKIIAGDIPSVKIYEDEHVYAFMDIMPLSKGHTLLVPKTHREFVYDLSPAEAANLFSAAPKIQPEGMNLLNNNGAKAGQSVFHFHLHFIPRYGETDGFGAKWMTKEKEFTAERIQELAEQVKMKLTPAT